MIDWERVDTLRADLGADGIALVTEIFTEDAQMLLAQIGKAVSAAAQEADLHRLRGGALNMGCTGLADACRLRERAARDGVMVTEAEVAALKAMCEASLAALSEGAPVG